MKDLVNLLPYDKFIFEKENLNEGLLDFLKNAFKKLTKYAEKIKGSEEIDKLMIPIKKEVEQLIEDKMDENNPKKDVKVPSQQLSTPENKNVDNTKTTDKTIEPKKESLLFEDAQETQNVQKNPIDEALDGVSKRLYDGNSDAIKNKSGKGILKKYIESDNIEVSLYAQGKLSEINTMLIQGKIKIYKAKKSPEAAKKMKEEVSKLKEETSKSSNIMKELTQKLFPNKKANFEVDKKYKYTNKKGEVTDITIKEIGKNGDVISAVTSKGVQIEPITKNIGELITDEKTK